MAEGQDQSLVYQRHKKTEKLLSFPFFNIGNNSSNSIFDIRSHTIGFCGKIYPVIELNRNKIYGKEKYYNKKESKVKYCYTLEDVDAFVKEYYSEEYIEKFFNAKKNVFRDIFWKDSRENFASFFNRAKERKQQVEEKSKKHFENMCPVFTAYYDQILDSKRNVIQYGQITYHDSLKQLEFFRVFDPFQAFQEINMWLANQAVPMKPIPEMPNDVKIEAAGFDKKISFRKRP